MKNLAILASGSGSNAEAIALHFRGHSGVRVALILCNKAGAGVFDRALRLGIPSVLISASDLESGKLLGLMREERIDFIILAGFLLKIPVSIVNNYKGRIINIHPALLPSYGGKGMYGNKVHEAVIANGEQESGITIHLVDEFYDHGEHLLQVRTLLVSFGK